MDLPGSGGPRRRHLDLSEGREVVFCHNCSNEWYNDDHGLQCPRCQSEICEIISPDNDPRDITPESPDSDILRGGHFGPTDFGQGHDHHAHDHRHDHDEYSDPDEDDLDHYMRGMDRNDPRLRGGPAGFIWSQNLYPTPGERQQGGNPRDPGRPRPVEPSSEQEIFQRFQETIDMLTGIPFGTPGRRPSPPDGGAPRGGGPGMRTTTYRSPSGHTSFTITTGAMPLRGLDHDDGFDITFSNFMAGGGAQPPRTQNPGLAGGIGDIFSLLLGPGGLHGAHGDAVYTQEGLDRIITQLMEQNPQSNAAPPASESAIEKLEKKQLDRQMMGDSPKVECTICIDEMHLGDEVTVLPCKHWFHGECVVLWLKEHNTCPICRTPIEKRGENAPGGSNGNGDNGAGDGSGSQQQRRAPGPGLSLNALFGADPWQPEGGSGSTAPSGSQQHNTRGARTPEDRERRLNAIRNLAGAPSYRRSASDSSRHGGQRRDSWSPTSPGPTSVTSARNRSPSGPRARFGRTNSSGFGGGFDAQPPSRASHSSGGNSGGSSNPLSWLRDRISGSGGSASGNNNGRRRS